RSPQHRIVGRYVVFGAIASGGMAKVHFGRLLGGAGFSRLVAIKRILPEFAETPELSSMLLDEARIASRIRHPNVVPTLDVVDDGGDLFLVMEYVHGETVANLMQVGQAGGQPIAPKIATSILINVLHGLQAAHDVKSENGEPLELVHRDVSPQNILVD